MATHRNIDTAKTLALGLTTYEKAKTLLFVYVVLTQTLRAKRHIQARGVTDTLRECWRWMSEQIILLVLRLPAAKKKVDTEMDKTRLEIEGMLVPQGANVARHLALPAHGQSQEWILQEMEKMDGELGTQANWRLGKLSGAVYHGGDELEKIIVSAFKRYCVSNPLHPDVFPAIRKMEAEIVSMCLRLYNNPDGAGTMTSGGTESIIMAVKTHRDWAKAAKGITEPEMIVPSSAHAAFYKAAAYLKIKVHKISVDHHTRKVDINRVKRAINGNTVMLVASAVNFPDGNQDDVASLGDLASYYNIGLHVDCCLGSFIMPFLEKTGLSEGEGGMFKLEPFDFRVAGVTSISCDTHKYGFTPKGSSVIMYRSAELRRYQYYVYPSWTGGLYASPSLSGSRPGALIAGTWAAMHYMGSDGYLESCRSIVSCARAIANAITDSIPELYVLGSPPASVVGIASQDSDTDVLEVGDAMSKKGWHLNSISEPPGVHIACTRLTVAIVETFIADLKDAVREAKLNPSGKGSMVKLYGLGNSSAVGPSMVGRVAHAYLDTLYKA